MHKSCRFRWAALLALGLCACTSCRRGSADGPPAASKPPSPAQGVLEALSQPVPSPTGVECNDGVDNDGDGQIDWQHDLGCYGELDRTEAALSRKLENGWTTFDPSSDSIRIYVSASDGKDTNDGRSPERPVKSIRHGASLVRDGEHDFLLLKRGDTWRGEHLGAFKVGKGSRQPLVIASYGASTARPRIEIDQHFINHWSGPLNYLALVGLEIASYPKLRNDPKFDGLTGGGLRLIGGGQDLLIEDCLFRHAEIVLQSADGLVYRGVEFRRNIVERAYSSGTCNQNRRHRPCGIYAYQVDRLMVEENLFDHNGWNAEEVPEACASMFNHNLYLTASNTVIRGNVLTRASSMAIKLRADKPAEVQHLTIEDNLIADGEIGISIGGNTSGPYRFTNVVIRNNVLSQIGLGNPTQRGLAWFLDVEDNDQLLVEGNLFATQPWFTNAYGIRLRGVSQRRVMVRRNTFFGLRGPSVLTVNPGGWEAVTLEGNTMIDTTRTPCVVDHRGTFSAVKYQANRYALSLPEQLCVDGAPQSLESWRKSSGETTAEPVATKFVDPERNLASYAKSIGFPDSIEAFVAEARKQSRFNYRDALSARAASEYIRAGFQPIQP
jgi:hypothetical protein